MARTRVFTKMVPGDSESMPAIRIEFKGKYQVDYFSLRKVAEEDFETNQTMLARLILHDWLLAWREGKIKGPSVQQMNMILRKDRGAILQKPKKKGTKDDGQSV